MEYRPFTARCLLLAASLAVLARPAAADLPTNVKLTPMFGTDAANRLRYPVWFGEVSGLAGVFAVLEQGSNGTDRGRVWLLEKDADAWVKKDFLALDVRKGEEPGLLGIAFHPGYADNRRYFIFYVTPAGASVLEERAADATLRKDAGSAGKVLITFPRNRSNHNGGQIAFGKDGYLYAGFGEDGQYDPAQRLNTFLGKLVRLDVDKPADGKPYGIPSGNPFAGSTDATVLKEIWAYGLRNPWRWSFDHATGDLWLADVGETSREEIDRVASGDNLGWPQTEGEGCSSFYPSCTASSYVPPVKTFRRDSSTCIVGGHVFRGNSSSEAHGSYVFAVFQLKFLYVMKLDQGRNAGVQRIGTVPDYVSAVGTDALGNLYALGWEKGIIYKLDDPVFQGTGLPTRSPPRRSGPFLLRGSAGPVANPAWFRAGTKAELRSLDGRRRAELKPGMALRGFPPGTYIARSGTAGGGPAFLVQLP